MALIAHYKLDGNALDSSGNKFHGTAVNPSYTSGRIAESMYFDGTTNPYVQIPNEVMKNLSEFSISIWYKCVEFNDRFLLSARLQSTDNWVLISVNSSSIVTYTCAVSNSFASTNSTGTWDNLIYTRDRQGNVSVYKNGTHIGTQFASSQVITIDGAIVLGQEQDLVLGGFSALQSWYGNIDDVKFFDHKLSMKEIKEINKCKVLHYKFDQLEEYTQNLWTNHYSPYFISAFDGVSYGFGSATNIQQSLVTDYNPLGLNVGVTKVNRINSDISQKDYISLNISSPLNSVRIVTFWYYGTYGSTIIPYNNDSCASLAYSTDGSNWSGTGTSVIIPVELRKWQKIYIRVTNRGITAGTGISWMQLHGGSLDTLLNTQNWMFTGIQVEEKDHFTPFVMGTRSDKIRDYSGYGNDATTDSLCPESSIYNKLGSRALWFKGAHKLNFPTLYLGNVDWSVSVWIKTSSTSGCVVSNANSGPVYNNLNILNGKINYAHYNNAWLNKTGTSNISDNNWHHLVWINDGASQTIDLYVDTVKELTASSTLSGGNLGPVDQIGKSWTSEYLNGLMDNLTIYYSKISYEDVVDLSKTRAEIHDNGNISSQQLIENSQFDVELKKNNLVINGDGRLGTNYGVSGLTYSTESFYRTGPGYTFQSDFFMEIDPSHKYAGEVEAKYGDSASTFYAGIACYDKNYNYIQGNNAWHYANTETTLSAPINNGDTVINITSSSGWSTGASSTKYFNLWDPLEEYPDYTYTTKSVLFTSFSGNQITLSEPWNKGSYPAGIAVANGYRAGTYMYLYANGLTLNSYWTKYGGENTTLSGWGINEVAGKFRYGTRYIKFLMLTNYGNANTLRVDIRNIKFYDLTDRHSPKDPNFNFNLTSSGNYLLDELIEFPTKGLIANYNFESLLVDQTSLAPQLINSGGVTSVQGIKGMAASFTSASSQYLYATSSDVLRRDELSVSLWIKTAGMGSGETYGGLVMLTNAFRIMLTSSGTILYKSKAGANYSDLTSSGHSSLLDNTWHHITCTYKNNGEKCIYIDGELKGSNVGYLNWTSTTENRLAIGWDVNSGAYHYNGLIDDVMIYSECLDRDLVNLIRGSDQLIIQKNKNIITPQFIEVI